MTRGGGDEELAPLFPRLHIRDAGKGGGGPRAPPRNKMALFQQITVPSNRFAPSTSAAQPQVNARVQTCEDHQHQTNYFANTEVYGYDRTLFQPLDVPSNEPAGSSEKFKGNYISGQSNSTRRESLTMSSQTKNKDVCASKSIVECATQHRVSNTIKSSGKEVVNCDEFMVPSTCSPRFYRHSTQEYADKSKPGSATNPHKIHSEVSKSSAECYSTVEKHLDRINEADMRLMNSPKVKEKESGQGSKGVEDKEKSSSIQASEKFKDKYARLCQVTNKASDINRLDNNGCQPTSVNGNSAEAKNPTATKNKSSCKPYTDVDSSNRNSNLLERSPREADAKRKRGHHNGEQNDDLSDSLMECIPGWGMSPDEIVRAIGPKHFWKARRVIQNQQRVFAAQLFELHKLIQVQKLIAASPHLLIDGDPVLGNALMRKRNKLPKNLKVQTLTIRNKDDIQATLEQPELSKQNTEGNPSHRSRDDGLGDNHHDQAATNETFTSNPPALPVARAPDNKQNNWCMNLSQNQWFFPVTSPSEGLVYNPYAGPYPPVVNLLTPFYDNCTLLRLPCTPYAVPMPHQPHHMVPPGAPAVHMNYFAPFTMPVMSPGTPASAVEQGSHAAAPQPGHMEQQSLISCNMSHPSGIWRFLASTDSKPQASSTSSPFDRLQVQGGGSGPVSFFPTASVLTAQPQPSSGGRDQHNHVIRAVPCNAQTASVPNAQPQPSSGGQGQQNHVIRVVPHKAQTASESAARIFQSILMERKKNDA